MLSRLLKSTAIPIALVVLAASFVLYGFFSRRPLYTTGGDTRPLSHWQTAYTAAWSAPGRSTPLVRVEDGDLVFRDQSVADILNTSAVETDPTFTPDGQILVFASNRAGSDFELYWSRREGGGFSPPEPLPYPANGIHNERSPSVAPTPDGGALLLFTSNRAQGLPHDYDIYLARGVFGGEWSPPERLHALSTIADERAATLHPDGNSIIFTRPGVAGIELLESWLLPGVGWSDPTPLPVLAHPDNEPRVTFREGGARLGLQRSGEEYEARLRILRELPKPSLLSGPAWLLLLLALLLLLLRLLAERWHGLEVLYRCLLVSILIHLLLWWWFRDQGIYAPELQELGPDDGEFDPIELALDLFSEEETAALMEAARGEAVSVARVSASSPLFSEFQIRERVQTPLEAPRTGEFSLPETHETTPRERPEPRMPEFADAPTRQVDRDPEALTLTDAEGHDRERVEREPELAPRADTASTPTFVMRPGEAPSVPNIEEWQSPTIAQTPLRESPTAPTRTEPLPLPESAAPRRVEAETLMLSRLERSAPAREEQTVAVEERRGEGVLANASEVPVDTPSRFRSMEVMTTPDQRPMLASVSRGPVTAPTTERPEGGVRLPVVPPERVVASTAGDTPLLAAADNVPARRAERIASVTPRAAESPATPFASAARRPTARPQTSPPTPFEARSLPATTSGAPRRTTPSRERVTARLVPRRPVDRQDVAADYGSRLRVSDASPKERRERALARTEPTPTRSSPAPRTHEPRSKSRNTPTVGERSPELATLASPTETDAPAPTFRRPSPRRAPAPPRVAAKDRRAPGTPFATLSAETPAFANRERALSVPRRLDGPNRASPHFGSLGAPRKRALTEAPFAPEHALVVDRPGSPTAPARRRSVVPHTARRDPLAFLPRRDATPRGAETARVRAGDRSPRATAGGKPAAGPRERDLAALVPKGSRDRTPFYRTSRSSSGPATDLPQTWSEVPTIQPETALDTEARQIPDKPAPTLIPWLSARVGPRKVEALRRHGGSDETERAVRKGLEYLASRQQRRGGWGSLLRNDNKYGETAVGKSALALLAFLGAGHFQDSGTKYSVTVERALDYLIHQQQRDSGHIGRHTSAYSHGIATYALAESYLLTPDPRVLRALERAVTQILRHQELDSRRPEFFGGWSYFYHDGHRYDRYPRASVTVWQLMALKTAELAGVRLPSGAMDAGRDYLARSWSRSLGKFLYNRDPRRLRSEYPTLPASTPASAFLLMVLQHDPDSEEIEGAVSMISRRLPRRWREGDTSGFIQRGDGNPYFWYYGTLALFLHGGTEWREWNAALKATLLPSQEDDGSWESISVYARYADDSDLDRSYTTALNVLMLEVYYRYLTPFQEAVFERRR